MSAGGGVTRRARPGRARSVAALLVLAAALPWGRPPGAQDIGVRARVDRSQVAEGGQLMLTVEVSGPSIGEVAPPDVSGITDFDIVGGPMTSNRFQWINGRTSAMRSYTYALRPRKTGTQHIPPLGLLVAGRTYRTEGIDVEVLPGGSGGVQGGPGRGGPPRGPGQGRLQTPAPDDEGQVRVFGDVDVRQAYLGQQVTLHVYLDTQTEILNLAMRETPTFPGFWAEEIKLPENLEMRRVQRGGEAFNEYTLMKRALFPTGTGTLTVPSMTYQIQVRRRSRDPIESFFFSPTETITRRTDPIAIQVNPLPDAGRPDDFSGAVGNFGLQVLADRREAAVNDAVGLKVRISGEGNLNAVNALPLPVLSDFKQYAPRIASSTSIAGDRLRSEKVWDYVLIPLAAGQQRVPPVSFSYFDPRAGAYRTVASLEIPIQVARGAGGEGGGYAPALQSDIRPLRRDIHFIKQASGGLSDRSRPLYQSPWFVVLLAIPPLANVATFVYARTRDSHRVNSRRRRERRARAQARRRLKEARRRMTPATTRAFYAEVAQALTDYVAAKFDTPGAGLTHERIEELLAARGVAPEERQAYHRTLEACDYARFAPTSSSPDEMRRTLQGAEEIIVRLERALAA